MFTNYLKSHLALAMVLTVTAPTIKTNGIYDFLTSKTTLVAVAGAATTLGIVGWYRGWFSSDSPPTSNRSSVFVSYSGNSTVIINGQRVGGANTQTEERRQDFTGISHLDVHDPVGAITVKTHDQNHVQVEQEIKYATQEQLDQLAISNTQNNGNLTIRVRYPNSPTVSSWFGYTSTVSTSPEVSHTILLPCRHLIDQTLATSSGKIKTSNGNGTLHAKLSSGNLTVDRHVGAMTAQATSGNINTTDTQGDLEAANLSSGNLTVNRHVGAMTARATSGNINTTDTQGNLAAKLSSGNLTADRHFGNLTAETTSGNIDISNYLAGALVKLRARVESIWCPRTLNKQKLGYTGEQAEGTIGDGQYTVNATTNVGTISFTGLQPE